MNLRYDLQDAHMSGTTGHAQQVMAQLGIMYRLATPQSLGGQWWFWGCRNVTDPLPGYLSILNVNPRDAIGYGLSKEQADMLEGSGE